MQPTKNEDLALQWTENVAKGAQEGRAIACAIF